MTATLDRAIGLQDSDRLATGLPRVTCIMPTRDRRDFVTQSLEYFFRQDYPNSELVVVDDGYDSVADLMPDDQRIRYIRLRSMQSVGAKRNLACQAATGDIIAHWDDDDWSAPHRLWRQVIALLESDADLCGLSEVLHYRLFRADGWLYRAPTDSQSEIAGCSIVYRRASWQSSRFPDVNCGEDNAFVRSFPTDRVVALADRTLLVAIVHGRNASSPPLDAPRWSPARLEEIGELLGGDTPFYAMLRSGRSGMPMAPRPRSQTTTPVTVASPFSVSSGYGVTGEYLALGLARSGASVRAIPLGMSPEGLSDELIAMTRNDSRATSDEPVVFHSWPTRDLESFKHRQNLFISTMFEANRLPPSWVAPLQQARAVIVPSTFVADTCRASGVTRPVVVVPLGADPDIYPWQPREEREGLVTLIVAPVDDRKHTKLGIAAWKAAFADDPAARLIIKTAYGYHNYDPDDPRISYVDRIEPTRGICDWYRGADVLLALGNEGFGLPMVEAMSTGLPVIALDAEGQADACRDARGMVLPVAAAGMEPHLDHAGGVVGFRSVPDSGAVEAHLRWVDEHRGEAREMGRAASAWTIANRSIWSVGPAAIDVIQNASGGIHRRIPSRTLWVTTAGTPCGIAAFTERLQANVPSVRLTARRPGDDVTGVVHIQHEPSIFNAEDLERFTARARARGVAIAITEHSVEQHPSVWERNASALVAATSAGAATLRARWPATPVVHIPLGCETWRFPRKSKRGRTVGFFGFHGGYKGRARLAAALRQVRGCDVVMYGYGPNAQDTSTDWPAEVPVRWHNDWLPLAEVAAGLAAQADTLVYHYDEFSHYSASSAVLLGLSTGVPVLTSDTAWFQDHGAAVHRAGRDSAGLAEGLERLLEDEDLRERTTSAARDYCIAHSWSRTAARHVELWNSLKTV